MQPFLQYRRVGQLLQRQIDEGLQNDKPYNHVDTRAHTESDSDKREPSRVHQHSKRLSKDLFLAQESYAACHTILKQHGHIESMIHSAGTDAENLGQFFIVQFTENDTCRPGNWKRSKKWLITTIVGAVGLLTSGAAAFDTEVVPQAMAEFHVSNDVALLATILYMIWFGLGTLFSGPLSEMFGRTPVYIISLIIFMLFTVGSAAAPNIATWLVCRSFMGLFGSPPAVTFGGTMSDMWSPLERVYIFPILAVLTFLGPFLAPFIADYMATSSQVTWHFVDWFTLILAGAICALIALFVSETYSPTLLSWKAQHLRKITGDDRYMAPVEINGKRLVSKLMHNVQRPWVFLIKETIVIYFAIYLVIIYITLFGSLVAFPFVFGREGAGESNLAIYFLSQREVGLCYIAMNVGFILAMPLCYPIYKRFCNLLKRENCHRVQPEEHLWWAMIGAPLLPTSILWLGLSAKPHIPIWSPLVAVGLFGFATLCIFITCYQYIIDSYERYAASALVGMTVTRYVASAALLPACTRMYQSLGAQNTLIIWAAASFAMVWVPYWFYFSGANIRKKSKRATDFGTRDDKKERDGGQA